MDFLLLKNSLKKVLRGKNSKDLQIKNIDMLNAILNKEDIFLKVCDYELVEKIITKLGVKNNSVLKESEISEILLSFRTFKESTNKCSPCKLTIPDKYLSNFLDKESGRKKIQSNIIEIKKKYPFYDNGIIRRIAMAYPNSSITQMDILVDLVERLQKKYRGIQLTVVQRAVFHYSKPEDFILKYLEQVEKMKNMFPGVKHGVINFVVKSHIEHPEKFIEGFLKRKKSLEPV